jgi:hypothetical protein
MLHRRALTGLFMLSVISGCARKQTFFISPTSSAIEIAPGLFADARLTKWRATTRPVAIEHPPFNLSAGDKFAIGVVFFAADQFEGCDVHDRETLTLPARPSLWPSTAEPELPVMPRTRISDDGRTCTTIQDITMKAGQMIPSYVDDEKIYILSPFPTDEWEVAADDPAGEWRLEAELNGKKIFSATLHVTAKPSSDK